MIAVDVGGTFTDVVLLEDGEIKTAKVTTDPTTAYEPVIQGAAELGVKGSAVFNHASTHGLNAIITRNLPKVAFLTTEGHRDILDHGRTWRPAEALLDPHWRRSFGDAARPLVPRYLRRGIRERTLASGEVLIELDEQQAREELRVLARCGVRGVAICLINAYVDHRHEERLRELVREELGDIACSISSEVSPLAKEYPRASTTVVDTFMKLIYSDYSDKLARGIERLGFTGQLNYADCAATLVPAERAMEQPFRIVFSGPAAGTVACAHLGQLIGERNLLCADVGGTSCDISAVTDGEPFVNTSFELEHDLIVNSLAIDISSIGAGGGSLVTVGGAGEILVGPGSAGADPGPACYGRGGTQPTTTDTCLLAGILSPSEFAGGRLQLDPELSREAFEALPSQLPFAERVRHAYAMGVNNIAEGVFNVAIKNGIDPRDYSLLAYGAAGPMLLPAVLEAIHCKQVVVPPNPGLFSALGLLSTDQVFTANRSAYTVLGPEVAGEIDGLFTDMEEQVRSRFPEGSQVTLDRSFDGRLVGQTWETPFVTAPDGTIDAAAVERMIAIFHETYEQRSGNRFEAIPVEGVTFRVRAVLATDKVNYPRLPARVSGDEPLAPVRTATLRYLSDQEEQAEVYERESLRAGDVVSGPAIITESLSTTHVGARQTASVGDYGQLVITQAVRPEIGERKATTVSADAAQSELASRLAEMSDTEFQSRYGTDRFTASVIRNRLEYVVEHMSTGFLREAFSPILRDWYDFACTISGPAEMDYPMSVVSNSLVTFLGTMGDALRQSVSEFGPENLSPGDVLICNDPYRAGSHVNDVLFMRPVFHEGRLISFVNMRSHQMDMGGVVPGGFSGTKANTYENGLVIAPTLLYHEDMPVRSTFSLIFDNARFGEVMLPDLKSVFQHLKLGERLVLENVERYGIQPYLGTLRYAVDASAERMRDAIAEIPDGDYTGSALVDADGIDAEEEYDIRVTLRKRGDLLEADLSGTSRQARTCINAGILDAKTAVGCALTMLLDPQTPFTTGTWRNVDIVVPPGSLLYSLPPEGAVMLPWESTSALITAVFRALNPILGGGAVGGDLGSLSLHNAAGVLPDGTPWTNAAQCGGEHGPWGATRAGDGDSYSVIAMSNNLDPATEAIEHDTPVVLLRKEAAIDTGGPGFHRGGAACIRDSLWLTAAEHWSSPFHVKSPTGVGANGGDAGKLGAVWMFPDDVARIAERAELLPQESEVYADSVPVAGMLDPSTYVADAGGDYFYFASRPSWKTDANAVFRYLTNGGGGWGDPFERAPERVMQDVRDGYVSIEFARDEYGVAIVGDPRADPEGLEVDEEETAALRAQRKAVAGVG
jgi:N-methylhydantoinase A